MARYSLRASNGVNHVVLIVGFDDADLEQAGRCVWSDQDREVRLDDHRFDHVRRRTLVKRADARS